MSCSSQMFPYGIASQHILEWWLTLTLSREYLDDIDHQPADLAGRGEDTLDFSPLNVFVNRDRRTSDIAFYRSVIIETLSIRLVPMS